VAVADNGTIREDGRAFAAGWTDASGNNHGSEDVAFKHAM
jgi:hypothetical protein